MNSKTIIFGGIIALAAVTLLMSPTIASAFVSLAGGTVDVSKNNLKVFFRTTGFVPLQGENGAFGYGVVSDGNLLVATTHKGVFDSESQSHPVPGTTVDVCNQAIIDAGFCEAQWHFHMVELGADTTGTCPQGAEVKRLTFQEPTKNTSAAAKHVNGINAPLSPKTFTNSFTGSGETFGIGGSIDGTLVQFDLAVNFEGTTPHVCVENVTPFTGTLK